MSRFQVKKVAVLGAGVMGAQIAAHLVNCKVPVVLFDLPAKEGPKNGIVSKAVEGLKKLKPAPLGVPEDASLIVQANYEEHMGMLTECDLVIEALLAERGFGPDDEVEVADDDSLALLQQASLGGLVAVGPRARRQVRRVQTLGGRTMALPPRTASCDGYNLNAGVGLKASDREGLERLCRYILRPPLAKARLSQ